jgi:hypothetical protein
MKIHLLSKSVLLSTICALFISLSTHSEVTTPLISVKTAEVSNFTNTHKQWRFEAVNYRILNTVANKYMTGHADGSVTLEVKDESSTAANQYWSVCELHSGHIALRNKGTGLSANDYRSDLQFVFSGDAEALSTSTLPVALTTLNGPGGALMKLDAATLIPVPGTSYTINTISWYTRSIVANSGNTAPEAIDNNDGTAYAQWQFEEVASDPAYPGMSYNKRIYNTKAGKYLVANNNSGIFVPALNTLDQTATANLQYWTIVTGGFGSIMIRNVGAGGINDLHQGASGADLVAAGTHEVNLTTANGPGGALLQLDDNILKIPVPGTDYSIQSISWYSRSVIVNEHQLTTVYPPSLSVNAKCFYRNNQILISDLEEPVVVTIYTVTGNVLASGLAHNEIVFQTNYKGVVLVRLESSNSNMTTFKLLTY